MDIVSAVLSHCSRYTYVGTGKLGETRPGWTSFPVEYVENSQRKNDIYKYISLADLTGE